jgi:S-formylglutathione hydrolase
VFWRAQQFYRHASTEIGLPMRFSVFLPPQALTGAACPAIFSGRSDLHRRNLHDQSRAQRVAAREGLILITPDTSPRGANIPGDSDAWDFGVGAGFYLDATEAPWSAHYRMESYIVHELRALLTQFLPIDQERLGIMGHSMGDMAH